MKDAAALGVIVSTRSSRCVRRSAVLFALRRGDQPDMDSFTLSAAWNRFG